MLHILHISDPHAQTETMRRLNKLAFAQRACHVVALTGDLVSTSCDTLPSHWDSWPQQFKLAVPGNHGDHSRAFQQLRTWVYQVPWRRRVQDLLFLGLGVEPAHWPTSLARAQFEREPSKGIVLVSHLHPLSQGRRWFGGVLRKYIEGRELLILHGDEHPRTFPGSVWDCSDQLFGRRIFRSHVCSSNPRGVGQRITWDGTTFTAREVRG